MNRSRVADLALFGGAPAFAERMFVGRPNVGDRERLLARVADMLDRRWLTNDGPYVRELEERLAAMLGVAHCVAMCNATIALEIAIRALGLSGEVIVPSFTFVATAHALSWQEIAPVFCDIDPATHNVDPADVERRVTPRTTGIVGVHLWGRPCDVEALAEIAARHDLKLLFDAAHAFGATHGGRFVGNFGDAEVFSFHATKFFNSFEGGAVATNDADLAARMRLMRNFGFAGYDDVVTAGTNGKMTEVCAAMGLTSLESMDDFVAVNRANYDSYRAGLGGVPGVRLLDYTADERGGERRNFQYVVLEVDAEPAGIGRDTLLDVLWAENVVARKYFYPGCHRMRAYAAAGPVPDLPATDQVASRVLSLPTGTAVGEAEIGALCEIIRFAVANGPEIESALADRRRAVAADS